MGSNMAECHPVAFRWPVKARMNGATLVHVDPRFTRTSANCDIHAPIRAGSDIAFLGGLINHVLNSERWNTEPFFRSFVASYTNAATIVSPEFPRHGRSRRRVLRTQGVQRERRLAVQRIRRHVRSGELAVATRGDRRSRVQQVKQARASAPDQLGWTRQVAAQAPTAPGFDARGSAVRAAGREAALLALHA